MMFREQIDRAVAILGSQTKLAREMGCSQQYISWLLNEADQISAETAMMVEKATRGEIKADELRPDLPWPSPPTASTDETADERAESQS